MHNYLVYRLDNGELTYMADEEALQHLDAETYGSVEVDPDWQQTHVWNPPLRQLEELPA